MAEKPIVQKRFKGRKKKSKVYFGSATQEAIIEYNEATSSSVRNKIYCERIHPAFDKLCENIIHTYKFYYFDTASDSVKHEVTSFLIMNIHKYDHNKGKAFSYFGKIAKNWLILNNNNNYKRYKMHLDASSLDTPRNSNNDFERDQYQKDLVGLFDSIVGYWDDNINKVFTRPKVILVADAIVELIRTREMIENFNKKALYLLIREMTGMNTQHITRILNIMKSKNAELRKIYDIEGLLPKKNKDNGFF